MPTGPMNRVADNARARELLGWEPQVSFVDGLHCTIDWYFAEKDPAEVRNLAGDPEQAKTLEGFRARLRAWQEKTGDPWLVKYQHE